MVIDEHSFELKVFKSKYEKLSLFLSQHEIKKMNYINKCYFQTYKSRKSKTNGSISTKKNTTLVTPQLLLFISFKKIRKMSSIFLKSPARAHPLRMVGCSIFFQLVNITIYVSIIQDSILNNNGSSFIYVAGSRLL